MMSTTQDDTGRAGRPFLRLLQPEEPNAPFKDSSYFRLGSYVAYNAEEDPLVTHLATTRSRVSAAPAMPVQSAADAVGLLGAGFSASFSAPSPGALSLEAIPSAPIPSTNDGVLLYTDHDLNETVGGAVLQKYGQGHVTQVTDCDSAYWILNGKYDFFAQNGINIHAGTKTAPSNIHIIAEGHMTQIAYGDYHETVSGNTHKEYQGVKSDIFYGIKTSILMDAESTVKLQVSDTVQIGFDTTMRLGGRFNLTVSLDANITVGITHNTTIGPKFDTTIGDKYETQIGNTHKFVTETDKKVANKDLKVSTSESTSICPGTRTKVNNKKISSNNVSVEKNTSKDEKSNIANIQNDVENKTGNILTEKAGSIKSVQAGMTMFL